MAGKTGPASRVAGKTFAFTGTLTHGTRAEVAGLMEAEGGKVVEEVTDAVDYLVVGSSRGGGPTATQKKAERLNQKGEASITFLEEHQLHELLSPTPEEARAMLQALPKGIERWRRLMDPYWLNYPTIDLAGADLRGLKLQADCYNPITLVRLGLDGADFRGATLVGVRLSGVRKARFDGADLRSSYIIRCEGCSFNEADLRGTHISDVTRCTFDGARITKEDKAGYTCFSGTSKHCRAVGADLTGARLNPADLSHGDFTRAKLRVETSSSTVARSTVFREADLRGAELEESKFSRADFTGADLSDAQLYKSDFKDANLEGAKLVKADLRNVNLAGANLSGADLSGANLNDADLRGARVDGADFADALVGGARAAGVDFSRAKNFDPARLNPPGAVGPNIRQLAKAARESKRLVASAELDVGGERVDVSVSGWNSRSGYHPGAHYTHYLPDSSNGSSVGAPTFEQGMLNLAKRWPRGRLKLETVTVTATKAPLRGKGLKELAVGAWCEAFGVEPPTAGQLADMEQQQKAGLGELREQLLADLRAGAAGVKRWNAIDREQREAVGHFRKLDLSGQKLAGVNLARLDFQGAVFDNANLGKAELGACDLRQASFKGARLDGAELFSAKLAGATFEGASLVGCNLRAIKSFRDVNFQGADLTRADLSHSDLRGADLSGAVLSEPTFYGTRFDEQTRFPAGFTLPEEGLMWAGTGPDPRQVPPAAGPPAGSLGFEEFLNRLRGQVDSAALAKALAMLKAERFQLFAEAGTDRLVGVVKSQSEPDLVYSCRLASDGSYGCCTQNLRRCGGLRGSLCKHLLVLVVGLTKAGALDAATVDGWVRASRGQRAKIDEEAMSATLLRYKGAEAGEIDWRPTQTIPEDYYAL